MTDQISVIPQYTVRHWEGFPWLSFSKETSLSNLIVTTSKYVLLKNLASVIHQALECQSASKIAP